MTTGIINNIKETRKVCVHTNGDMCSIIVVILSRITAMNNHLYTIAIGYCKSVLL
jgi:hypothetical protein